MYISSDDGGDNVGGVLDSAEDALEADELRLQMEGIPHRADVGKG